MMSGKCLLGDQTSMIFRCKNNGGDAHFKFSVKEDISNSSILQGSNYSGNLFFLLKIKLNNNYNLII